MDQLRAHLLLALWVLVGSAIPFVPTGEVVSAAAAVGSYSKLNAWLIFGITWLCSVVGDCLLLLQVRFGARWLRPRIERSKAAPRVAQAQEALTRNSFHAIVTGRLIPGGRTPVIAALGLSHFPIRRFLPASLVACALWAGIYSSIGTIGGRIAHHPVWATVIAISLAISIGVAVQQLQKLWSGRQGGRASEDGAPGEGGAMSETRLCLTKSDDSTR
ncbi:MAG TPA: VTT domain-containing protein [Microlunatus sp.]|nr:VTT domain-containing protein [Microlunatus sp.]